MKIYHSHYVDLTIYENKNYRRITLDFSVTVRDFETFETIIETRVYREISLEHAMKLINNIPFTKVNMSDWKQIQLKDLFEICKGSRLTKMEMRDGAINFIGASSFNNGITCHISNNKHLHPGGTLTTTYNGSDIGRTFYQKDSFWATDDVNVLYPKFEINKYIALFLAPIIKAAGSKYIYKNKWKIKEMENSYIYLPFKDGNPDWKYMENKIKKLDKLLSTAMDNYSSL